MKKLSLIEIAFFLKKVSLFEDLDLDILVAIADKMNQDIYDKNEKVFDINQKPIRMYFIITGSINLIDLENKIFAKLKEKDFFSDEALFNNVPRKYFAICEQDSLLLTLTKTNLMNIISECPSVATVLLKKYAKTMCYKNKYEN